MEMVARSFLMTTLMRRSGSAVSTLGRRPNALVKRSAMASLTRTAVNCVLRSPSLTPVGVDGDRAVGTDVLLPGNRRDRVVELVGGGRGDARQRQQDAGGDARPQQGAVGAPQRTAERDAARQRSDSLARQRAQLVGDQRLGATGACGPELQIGRHVPLRIVALLDGDVPVPGATVRHAGRRVRDPLEAVPSRRPSASTWR